MRNEPSKSPSKNENENSPLELGAPFSGKKTHMNICWYASYIIRFWLTSVRRSTFAWGKTTKDPSRIFKDPLGITAHTCPHHDTADISYHDDNSSDRVSFTGGQKLEPSHHVDWVSRLVASPQLGCWLFSHTTGGVGYMLGCFAFEPSG